jgi:hypothetical protein
MRLLIVCVLVVNLLAFSGCSANKAGGARPDYTTQSSPPAAPAERPAAANDSVSPYSGMTKASEGSMQRVKAQTEDSSLTKADNAQAASEAIERKIIRNGKLTIETDSPTSGQSKITSIAESLGGFVITSEFKQGGASASESVIITVRVPATQFNEALEKIRTTGNQVLNENVTGQDVTEEFLDLEARIKTKKALEAQFLEIMKQAKNVSDALEVQTEISNVRTEIERMEGRKRFLQNQASLSTIIITLQTPPPILVSTSTSGFGHSIKQAFAEGIDLAALIVLGLIRLIIVLIPITLFIFLPLGLILKFIVRRLRNNKKSEPIAQPQS